MKIEAVQRLLAYDPTWVPKMHRQTELKYHGQPKPQMLEDEQIFKLAPSALAQRLKSLYGPDGYASAMGALTAYKNRAGKTLLSPDKDRLEKAKQQLRKIYGRDKDQSKPKAPGSKSRSKNEPTNDRPIGSRPSGRII